MRKEKLLIFFKIQIGNKDMLQNLIIGSKYWEICKLKIILTIILMKHGKTFKQYQGNKKQLIEKDESIETLNIDGTMRNAKLQ